MGKNFVITFQRQLRRVTTDNRMVDAIEVTAKTLPGEYPFSVEFPVSLYDDDLVAAELERRATQLERIAGL